jgi:chemotaxis protein methyltransferase CheR
MAIRKHTPTGLNTEILSLPDAAGGLLRDLIHERTGIFYDNGRAELLADKISPLVVERGLNSLLDYYYLLKYDEAAQDEWQNVMDTLSVPETYFWREMDQVHALVDVVLPEWAAQTGNAPFRIWSAGCATGEEPLTLAMALSEAGWFDRLEIDIYASDASPRVIDKARRGVFRERSFRNLSPEMRAKYFMPEDELQWRVTPTLHRRIRWSVANLREEAKISSLATANSIFCRNVFIYFSAEAVRKTLAVFAEHIRQPGFLFVATAESLLRMTTRFTLEEIGNAFVYVRSGASGNVRLGRKVANGSSAAGIGS